MTDAAQTILIIDDNPVNLRVLSAHLRQCGFMVVAAQDGEEGLERARIVKPDLILLDIMMPGINGLETCRRLKASDITCEIPVIFKTSLTDTATKIAGFEAGGVDYVTSPIQIEEVMARVQTHLTLHTVKKRLEQQNLDLQKEVEVRERAERALEQARDELEERVQQRTAELRAEITERKRAEEALQRINRELRAISECNQTLMRATDEQTLINDICRIVCEQAGYRMAWVGYSQDDDAKSIRPVAWAGFDNGYLATADISWSEDSERGRGPSGRAIRSGKTCYVQDFTTDASVALWRDGALKCGYRSIISLPLKAEDGKALGTLTIYSSEPNAFSPEEIRLLEEMAGDLAYGIITLRTRAERERAEQEVLLLRFALDTVQEAALLIDEGARFRYINDEACRCLEYSREELLGMSMPDIDPDFPIERWQNHWNDLKSKRSMVFEGRHRAKDGHLIPVEISANYLEYGGNAYNLALVRDITERKRAEEALRRLNRALRAISRCNEVLIRAVDEQTIVREICRVVCEEAAYRMAWVGYAEQDPAKSVRPVAWFGAEDGDLDKASITWADTEQGRGTTGTAIRTGITTHTEDLVTDAQIAPWQQSALQRGYRSSIALPLKDEHGSAFGALTIYAAQPHAFASEERQLLEELAGDLAFGITVIRARIERERAEKTLALRSFALNSVHESVLLIDQQGRFRDVNEECCRFLGCSREQLLDVGVWEFDPEMSADRWPKHWADLKAHRSLTFERQLRSKGGRIANVEINANYFEYDDVAYNIALVRDITERKRAEQKLKESEERMRLALEAARIGSFDWDMKTGQWCASPTYYTALGYEPRQGPGDWSKWAEDFHPEDRAHVVQLIEDTRAGRRGEYEYEARIRHADGSYRWIHMVAFGIERDSDGNVTRVLGLRMDVTERKRAEEEKAKLQQHLHQAQKMEAIGQLASGVAHDFNNILAIISGYSEILLKVHNLTDAQREPVEEILAAGQRAAALTRQLLAFSRKLLLQPKVLNLNSIVDGLGKMLRRLIGDEIEVRTILDPNLSAVNADPNQMEQVLLNFCINARDAMPDGGRITIETANVDVNDTTAAQHRLLIKDGHLTCPICGAELQPGCYVKLSVSDTGIGMDQETMSHIFEPFFTTKGPERGTGLGLATVYGIVKQSGGHVLVDSAPGQGATFRLYIPVATQQAPGPEQEPMQQEIMRGSETILLVEDNAPLRIAIRKLIESDGYTVLAAEDGERAIQVSGQHEGSIALLLTDVSLPKMRGPALAEILLQQRSTMKVLFMSGHGVDAVSGPNQALHASPGFIQKPFGAEELFRKLREMLDPHEPEKVA
jgi:PAS domain S-box-containing protein